MTQCSKRSKLVNAAVAMALGSGAALADTGINIRGDVTQSYEVKTTVQTAAAVGNWAKAETGANIVEGNVTLGGSLKQTVTGSTLVQTAAAVGNFAEAKARINVLSGK